MALVPHNRHLRVVDKTPLNPVAIALAYQRVMKWQGPKDEHMVSYISQLAVVLAAAPSSWRNEALDADDDALDAASALRSHHPDDLHATIMRFAGQVRLCFRLSLCVLFSFIHTIHLLCCDAAVYKAVESCVPGHHVPQSAGSV
jgi:hypothetical protein